MIEKDSEYEIFLTYFIQRLDAAASCDLSV